MVSWKLVKNPTVPQFTVSWPGNESPPTYRFVRISSGKDEAILKIAIREGASVDELWASTDALKSLFGKVVDPSEARELEYHLYRLRHDPYQLLTLLGSAATISTVSLSNLAPSESPIIAGITPVKLLLAAVGIVGAIVAFIGFMLQADR
jgi:hypothetical protein